MSHRATLALAFVLIAAANTVPVGETSIHNNIGGPTNAPDFLPTTTSRERRIIDISADRLTAVGDDSPATVDATVMTDNYPAFIELNSDKVGQGDAYSESSSWLVGEVTTPDERGATASHS